MYSVCKLKPQQEQSAVALICSITHCTADYLWSKPDLICVNRLFAAEAYLISQSVS